MVREVMIAQCGIQFDEAALVRASIPVLATPPASPFEASPQELELDRADALEPLHDNLKSNVLWWLLELIPLQFSYQAADGVWHKNFECVHRISVDVSSHFDQVPSGQGA